MLIVHVNTLISWLSCTGTKLIRLTIDAIIIGIAASYLQDVAPFWRAEARQARITFGSVIGAIIVHMSLCKNRCWNAAWEMLKLTCTYRNREGEMRVIDGKWSLPLA